MTFVQIFLVAVSVPLACAHAAAAAYCTCHSRVSTSATGMSCLFIMHKHSHLVKDSMLDDSFLLFWQPKMEPIWINSSCWRLLIFLVLARIVSGTYYIPYQTPQNCINLSVGAATSWYFDTTQLKCVQCSQSSSFQTTSADG